MKLVAALVLTLFGGVGALNAAQAAGSVFF